MPKSNAERQKEFRDRQDKKAKAGVELYKIFDAHFKDFKQFLSASEKQNMNEIGDVLEDA